MLELHKYFEVQLSMRELFEHPTVASLAARIQELRSRGPGVGGLVLRDDAWVASRWKYLGEEALPDSDIDGGRLTNRAPAIPEVLLVTGATGFVGSHILAELLLRSKAQLLCLVRASDPVAGKERIRDALVRYEQWRDTPEFAAAFERQVEAVLGDVSAPNLGLGPAYDALSERVDGVLHGAAHVNFIYPYAALKPTNVEGTRSVLRFSTTRRLKSVHFVSTSAVWPMGAHRTFAEDQDLDHGIPLNLGYDEAKWVAERMLRHARLRGVPVAIYRPGEVSGHSKTGRCVVEHFAFAILKGALMIESMPPLACLVDFAPVDYVAQGIAQLTATVPAGKSYHLTNPKALHARDAYRWMRDFGYSFDEPDFDGWYAKLVNSREFRDNPLYPYAAILGEFRGENMQLPLYETINARSALEPAGVSCPPLEDPLIRVYLDYFFRIGFLTPPPGRKTAWE